MLVPGNTLMCILVNSSRIELRKHFVHKCCGSIATLSIAHAYISVDY